MRFMEVYGCGYIDDADEKKAKINYRDQMKLELLRVR